MMNVYGLYVMNIHTCIHIRLIYGCQPANYLQEGKIKNNNKITITINDSNYRVSELYELLGSIGVFVE